MIATTIYYQNCKIGAKNVYIAISGCRSLSQSLGDIFGLAMVENPGRAAGPYSVSTFRAFA